MSLQKEDLKLCTCKFELKKEIIKIIKKRE